MVGSVAATDSHSNDTTIIKKTSYTNEVETTATSTNTEKSSNTVKNVNTEISSNTNNELENVDSISYNKRSSNTKTATSKIGTNTKVSEVTSSINAKTTLNAVVTTKSGAYVPSGTVTFKINGKSIGSVNVTSGNAKLSYTIPSSWTDINYKIEGVYSGNSKYQESTGTNTLKLKSNYNTVMKVKTVSGNAGEKVILQATLTTNGNYVKKGKVAFKINGKTIGTATVSNGGAKLSYTIPKSYTDKQYTITATFGSNYYYKAAKSTGTLKVTPIQNTITSIGKITANQGATVTFTANIKGTAGDIPNGGKVVFKINGKTIGTTTASKGVAKLTYTIPSSWSGKYDINVLYGGHNVFKASKASTTLQVNSKTSVPSGFEAYVKSTTNCPVSNSKIQSLSKSLTSGLTSTYSKAVSIFNYVRDKVSYSSYYNTRYGAVGTLNRKYGNCVDQTHLLIALLRAANIPARYCHATCYFRSGLVTGHVWAGVYVNGKWYTADTTSRSNSFGKVVNWNKCGSIRRYISLPF